jgi:hypothetical protein
MGIFRFWESIWERGLYGAARHHSTAFDPNYLVQSTHNYPSFVNLDPIPINSTIPNNKQSLQIKIFPEAAAKINSGHHYISHFMS